MGYAFWSEGPVVDHAATLQVNVEAYRRFAAALLDEGVHVISRGLLYVSTAHTQADLELTRAATRRAAEHVRRSLDEPVAASARPG